VLDDKLKTISSKNSGGEKKRFFDNKTQNNNLKFYNFYFAFSFESRQTLRITQDKNKFDNKKQYGWGPYKLQG